jgi:F-type H+-transporting ATPase subunit b
MPAFLELAFYNPSNPELWVAVGLVLFLAIAIYAGAHRTAFGVLDAKAATIKFDLDEAARLRTEAEAMLVDIRRQREETEAQGIAMLEQARADAERLAAEAKVKLEEQIVRRTALADRRIANAEREATAEVKSAAADLAAQMAETILADRLKGMKTDPMVAPAVEQLASRLQ